MRTSNSTIMNNRCCNNSLETGIILTVFCMNNTIMDNVCADNVYGMDLDTTSNHNTVLNNIFESNSYGLCIFSSRKNNITNNNFSNNTNYGIYVYSSTTSISNRIWNNTFYHNNGGSDSYSLMYIQAMDDGTSNRWNTSNGYGNWWSDLTGPDNLPPYGIVDWPYNISSGYNAQDHYPLTNRPESPIIPEFSDFAVPVAGLMLISLAIGRLRKQRGDC